MSLRWCLRVGALLLVGWLLGASALRAQVVCGPADTTVAIRQGGGLAYIIAGGDSVRHTSGVARGWTTIDRATAVASWLAAFHENVEVRQTIRVRIRGCLPVVSDTVRLVDTVLVPSSPGDARDTIAVPPAIDSLPPAVPEQPPQDTVAPDPGTPSARGVITCQPEALCSGDAHASVGDSVVWMDETGPGTAARLGDFQGLQWGPRVVSSPRARTWWLVAWSGSVADTARVVWIVPVTEATVYTALPLGTEIGTEAQLLSWVVADPRDGQGVTLRAAWGTPAVESCAHVWLWAAWTPALDSLQPPGDTLWRAWLPPRLVSCRGVIR